ncbi:hypothetical protein ACTZWT_15585 [Rhodopseudomonas sp. NSM]|uniref:hypothetical protein n=1 Tax=Rhodopseudomonas sp. NSM TaxID=3457630 RepID=UPI004035598A
MVTREKARFKRTLEELIRSFKRKIAPDAVAPFIGAVDEPPLEHTTRKHFLDGFLEALGWDLSNLDYDVVEEARIHGETTLFLDYVGAHPEERLPLLIFEAKAWSKPLVAAARSSDRNKSHSQLIAAAITHCKAKGDEASRPVLKEWYEWLGKLVDYVRGMHVQSGHVVPKVAISSGRWLVVFTDPANAFIADSDVEPSRILIFDIENYVEFSGEIFDLLARSQLVRDPPVYINCEQILAHASDASVRRVFRAAWVSRVRSGSPFDIHPQIQVYPAAVIERSDRGLVTIIDRSVGRETVPSRGDRVAQHRVDVGSLSDALLAKLKTFLPSLPQASSIAEFPGFPTPPTRGMSTHVDGAIGVGDRRFVKEWPHDAEQFILVTGDVPHYLMEGQAGSCIGHDWAACRKIGEEVGENPVLSPTLDPAAYFVSGESHHCAHRQIHGRRVQTCKLQAFEDYMCCKVCVFEPICWDVGSHRPCGTVIGPDVDAPAEVAVLE